MAKPYCERPSRCVLWVAMLLVANTAAHSGVHNPDACVDANGIQNSDCCANSENSFCTEGHVFELEGGNCCFLPLNCQTLNYFCYIDTPTPTLAPTLTPTALEGETPQPTPPTMEPTLGPTLTPTVSPTPHTGIHNPSACVRLDGSLDDNCCSAPGDAFCSDGHVFAWTGGDCCGLFDFGCNDDRFECYIEATPQPTPRPTPPVGMTAAPTTPAPTRVPTPAPTPHTGVPNPAACTDATGARDGDCCGSVGNAFCADGHIFVWESDDCCAWWDFSCSDNYYTCYMKVGITFAPTPHPTLTPTAIPTTAAPTEVPTEVPTRNPTGLWETSEPISPPTSKPTLLPTESPTMQPTRDPSMTWSPTSTPTVAPTPRPTPQPIPHSGVVNEGACVDAYGTLDTDCCGEAGNTFCTEGHIFEWTGGDCCSWWQVFCDDKRYACYIPATSEPSVAPTPEPGQTPSPTPPTPPPTLRPTPVPSLSPTPHSGVHNPAACVDAAGNTDSDCCDEPGNSFCTVGHTLIWTGEDCCAWWDISCEAHHYECFPPPSFEPTVAPTLIVGATAAPTPPTTQAPTFIPTLSPTPHTGVPNPDACMTASGDVDGNCCGEVQNSFCAEGHTQVWEGGDCCSWFNPFCDDNYYTCYIEGSRPPTEAPTEPLHSGVPNPSACVDATGQADDDCCNSDGNSSCTEGHYFEWDEGGGKCCDIFQLLSCDLYKFNCFHDVAPPTTPQPTPPPLPSTPAPTRPDHHPGACVDHDGNNNCCGTSGSSCTGGYIAVFFESTCCDFITDLLWGCDKNHFECVEPYGSFTHAPTVVPTPWPAGVSDPTKCLVNGTNSQDCCGHWAQSSCEDDFIKQWTGIGCCDNDAGDCWNYVFGCVKTEAEKHVGRVTGELGLVVSDPAEFCSGEEFLDVIRLTISRMLDSMMPPEHVAIQRCGVMGVRLRRRLQDASQVAVDYSVNVSHTDRRVAREWTVEAELLMQSAVAADVEAVMLGAMDHLQDETVLQVSVEYMTPGQVTFPEEDGEGFDEEGGNHVKLVEIRLTWLSNSSFILFAGAGSLCLCSCCCLCTWRCCKPRAGGGNVEDTRMMEISTAKEGAIFHAFFLKASAVACVPDGRRFPSFEEVLNRGWLQSVPFSPAQVVGGEFRQPGFLVVGHSWVSAQHPDPKGEQLSVIKKHLAAHPKVRWIWYDYCCMPLQQRAGRCSKGGPTLEQSYRALCVEHMLWMYLAAPTLLILDARSEDCFWSRMQAYLASQEPCSLAGLAPCQTASRFESRTLGNQATPVLYEWHELRPQEVAAELQQRQRFKLIQECDRQPVCKALGTLEQDVKRLLAKDVPPHFVNPESVHPECVFAAPLEATRQCSSERPVIDLDSSPLASRGDQEDTSAERCRTFPASVLEEVDELLMDAGKSLESSKQPGAAESSMDNKANADRTRQSSPVQQDAVQDQNDQSVVVFRQDEQTAPQRIVMVI